MYSNGPEWFSLGQIAPPVGLWLIPLLLCLGLCVVLLVAKVIGVFIEGRLAASQNNRVWPSNGFVILLAVANLPVLILIYVRVQPVWYVLASIPLAVTVGLGANMTRRAEGLKKITSYVAGAFVVVVLYALVLSTRNFGAVLPVVEVAAVVAGVLLFAWVGLSVAGWWNYISKRGVVEDRL